MSTASRQPVEGGIYLGDFAYERDREWDGFGLGFVLSCGEPTIPDVGRGALTSVSDVAPDEALLYAMLESGVWWLYKTRDASQDVVWCMRT